MVHHVLPRCTVCASWVPLRELFWVSIFRLLCPTPPLFVNWAAIGTHSNSIEDYRNIQLCNMHTHFLFFLLEVISCAYVPTPLGFQRWKTAASLSPASCAPLTVLALFTPGAVPPKPRYFGTCLSNAGGMEGLGVKVEKKWKEIVEFGWWMPEWLKRDMSHWNWLLCWASWVGHSARIELEPNAWTCWIPEAIQIHWPYSPNKGTKNESNALPLQFYLLSKRLLGN